MFPHKQRVHGREGGVLRGPDVPGQRVRDVDLRQERSFVSVGHLEVGRSLLAQAQMAVDVGAVHVGGVHERGDLVELFADSAPLAVLVAHGQGAGEVEAVGAAQHGGVFTGHTESCKSGHLAKYKVYLVDSYYLGFSPGLHRFSKSHICPSRLL